MSSLFGNRDGDGRAARFEMYQKVAVVERNLAGGRLLVQRLDFDRPTQLSGSAPLIWDLLDTHKTVDELVERLAERFSDSSVTIEAGVRSALDSLAAQGLVVTS